MKKAVSLSINFLVMIIIVIIVVGLFFILFYKFMGESEEASAKLEMRYVNEIQRLVSGGEKVAVYPKNIEIGAGKAKAVGVGILNELGKETSFAINAECNATIINDVISECDPAMVSLVSKETALENNAQEIIPVVISINNDADYGTYIINIEVVRQDTSEVYDKLVHKVYVKV